MVTLNENSIEQELQQLVAEELEGRQLEPKQQWLELEQQLMVLVMVQLLAWLKLELMQLQ